MSLNDRHEYLLSCDRCSHCKWVPGAKSEQFAQACPSIQYGQFHSYSASGKAAIAFGLKDQRLDYSDKLIDSVYACTMCGACDTSCKWNHSGVVEPLDTLYELRAHLAADDKVPAAFRILVDNLRREGNPAGKPRAERARWAAGLSLPNVRQQRCEVLLYIGSDNAYDEAHWPTLRQTVAWLQAAKINFGIAYDDEPDSGELAFDLGYQDVARTQAQALAALMKRCGATTLISCSAASYAAFRNTYPRLGVSLAGITVQHITDVLATLLSNDLLPVQFKLERKVTYHDPCKLGRLSEPYVAWSGKRTTVYNQVIVDVPPRPVLYGNQGNYQSARTVLGKVEGLQLLEMERTGKFSYCCGAGAGAAEAAPEFASHTALHRLQEAQATGADMVVSACGKCTQHLKQVAAMHRLPIEVKSLLQLLTDASGPTVHTAQEA